MPGDFLLRPTERGDLPTIAEIYREAVLTGTASYEIDPPSADEMTRRWHDLVSNGFPHLVAERAGMVIGYAYAGPYRPRPAYRYSVEDSIYIAPAAQRGGIGRIAGGTHRYLRDARIPADDRGDRRRNEHPASVGLHERLGFRTIGVIEGSGFKHGRWLDTVLMQRALGPGCWKLPEGD